jgi:transposase
MGGFKPYAERVLVPTLKRGDILMMDNLGSQGRCCPPRYSPQAEPLPPAENSPDLNPIEQFFAKAQTHAAKSRKANRRSRLQCDRPDPRLCHLPSVQTSQPRRI